MVNPAASPPSSGYDDTNQPPRQVPDAAPAARRAGRRAGVRRPRPPRRPRPGRCRAANAAGQSRSPWRRRRPRRHGRRCPGRSRRCRSAELGRDALRCASARPALDARPPRAARRAAGRGAARRACSSRRNRSTTTQRSRRRARRRRRVARGVAGRGSRWPKPQVEQAVRERPRPTRPARGGACLLAITVPSACDPRVAAVAAQLRHLRPLRAQPPWSERPVGRRRGPEHGLPATPPARARPLRRGSALRSAGIGSGRAATSRGRSRVDLDQEPGRQRRARRARRWRSPAARTPARSRPARPAAPWPGSAKSRSRGRRAVLVGRQVLDQPGPERLGEEVEQVAVLGPARPRRRRP